MSTANEKDNELNTRREIPYLQATMYYFVYYVNILLTRTYCHSYMAPNRMSDMPAADWLCQTCEKVIVVFSSVVIRFF